MIMSGRSINDILRAKNSLFVSLKILGVEGNIWISRSSATG